MANTPFESQPKQLNKVRLCNGFNFVGTILVVTAALLAYETRFMSLAEKVPLTPTLLLTAGVCSFIAGNILGRNWGN